MRRKSIAAIRLGLASALMLAAPALPRLAGAANLVDPNLRIESRTVTGLSLPTGMRFLASDDAFVIEKNTGKVKRVQGTTVTEVLDLDVSTRNERGLIGIELHPSFDSNGWVYLHYSARNESGDGAEGWAENRVSRFTWDATSQTLGSEMSIFSIANDGQAAGPNHDGGPLRFGPDGKLYIATGDLNRFRGEQNQSSTPASSSTGGIYRVNDDGTTPTDNPLLSNDEQGFHKLFAYGVRNSFGMAFDPETGKLWDTENGPSSMDEINVVAPGFNSGWTILMGPESRDSNSSDELLDLIEGTSTYSDPEFSFSSTIGITSIAFLSGSLLGSDYDDAVVIGDNNTSSLHILRLNQDRDGFALDGDLADLVADSAAERLELLFGTEFETATDLQVGPDGAFYVLSLESGEIHRITLVPEPGTAGLFALGLAALAAGRRRDARQAA